MFYPDLDVCHKATSASKIYEVVTVWAYRCRADSCVRVCVCVTRGSDDASRPAQLSDLKALARSHSLNETPMSAGWLRAVVSSKGFSRSAC